MSVTIFNELHARSGRDEDLVELLRAAREVGLSDRACKAYELYQDSADPNRIVLLERWESPAAHQDHFQRQVLATGVLDTATSLMTQPPPDPVYYVAR